MHETACNIMHATLVVNNRNHYYPFNSHSFTTNYNPNAVFTSAYLAKKKKKTQLLNSFSSNPPSLRLHVAFR